MRTLLYENEIEMIALPELYDTAIIGIDENEFRIIYDVAKIVEIVIDKGECKDIEEAMDYVSASFYAGWYDSYEHKPIFRTPTSWNYGDKLEFRE